MIVPWLLRVKWRPEKTKGRNRFVNGTRGPDKGNDSGLGEGRQGRAPMMPEICHDAREMAELGENLDHFRMIVRVDSSCLQAKVQLLPTKALMVKREFAVGGTKLTLRGSVRLRRSYVDRKAVQITSKYDGKEDIESWISSMRACFEVLGTQPETQSVIMGMNVEPVVRGFLEVQATRVGIPKIELTRWLKTPLVASHEELLISQYLDPHAAARARIQLDKMKRNKWTGSMKSLQTYLSKMLATPGLEPTAQSCLDVVKGAVPPNFTNRLGRDFIGYTDWFTLMKDIVSLEAVDLVTTAGSKKPMGGRRFKGSNRFAVHDLLEAEEEADADDPTLDDDQEQDYATTYSIASIRDLRPDLGDPFADPPPPSVPPDIQNLLDRFLEVLAKPHGVPTRSVRHTIELVEGVVPPKGCVYRMGPGVLEELRQQIDEMIDKGWIKPSESEFGAPMLFVPKKGGKLRMCIDYRGLNRITRKNAYPLPRIDDLLDAAGGCKVFSKIDLKSGYHEIEVDPADQHKTAFKTRDGLYEFTVMPFGLTNAPATFQSLMDKVLREQIGRFMVVYLDDILFFSKSMEEHLKHLEEVLTILKKTQLHLNLEKSEFGKDSVIYLGHRLSAAGLEPEATKVDVISNWPQPVNFHELRSFLGLASYYPKFVPRFSIVVRPLSRLISKNVPYSWDTACTNAFQALKEALVSYPVLRIADPKPTFVANTDASQYGINAMLQQDDDDGSRPLEYYSKRMPSVKLIADGIAKYQADQKKAAGKRVLTVTQPQAKAAKKVVEQVEDDDDDEEENPSSQGRGNGGRERGNGKGGQGGQGGGRGGNWNGQGGNDRPRFDWRNAICHHCALKGHTFRFCQVRNVDEGNGLISTNMDRDVCDMYGKYIDRKIAGGMRKEALRRAELGLPPPAMFRLWQEEDVRSTIKVEELANSKSEEDIRREEPVVIEKEEEEESYCQGRAIDTMERMEDLVEKMQRLNLKMRSICDEVAKPMVCLLGSETGSSSVRSAC
ncbi:hypothetical protein CBR_g12642 [Chara braunii]|uniref:Reverse transcriptase domain-containing protein n=1 Tax=Chara braunii TaxID=69332 RepID=A0A388KS84_CHABU|nr:hypothetical protein CBR_g12642 [Chara braunii]|eukprot:GBG72921.1 hypothetical protein CBR_g12642 [Chara braunii]